MTKQIPAELRELAQRHGYGIEYRPTVRVRGWPNKSARPFALYLAHASGAWDHLCSFATVDGLERNLRARAGL